jgi:hypothetical protein
MTSDSAMMQRKTMKPIKALNKEINLISKFVKIVPSQKRTHPVIHTVAHES